ncbi:MAG: DUF4105 domain-containing protein [Pseudomonadota bacterium]
MQRFLIVLLLLLAPVLPAPALASFDIADEEVARLSSTEQWRILGRWKRSFVPGRALHSDIITDSFFLAERGRYDPEAELRATLEGLAVLLADDPSESALCRFPGRAIFLRQQGVDVPDPIASCPDVKEFFDDGDTNSVSVLFISGYLSNPGSAFGHLLLRFHAEGDDEPVEDVLDRAINYGAASSEEDPIIPYILKGLFGRYQSTYTTLQFFHQAERYREMELRTIWQYKLDLTPDENELLVAHVYELLTSENRYYFLRQNCAWRIAETLELVVDRDLIPDTKPWVTPIDVFHQLTGDEVDGGDAVRDVKRLASRETLFLEGYRALRRDEKRLVDDVIAEPQKSLAELTSESSVVDARKAHDVLVDYYAFTDDTEELDLRGQEVTVARFALPPSERPTEQRRIPPHTGQRPSLFQVSALYNDELGEGVEIRLRPAYFDLLSTTVGTVPYSEVAMGDVRALIRDGRIDLRSLEVVRVTSLSPKSPNTPSSGGLSWRVRVGAEDESLACDDCLLGYAEYGVGKAYEFARGAAVYGLVAARVEAGRQVDSIVHARPSLGVVINRRYTGLSIEGGVLQGLDDDDESRLFGKAEWRLGAGQRWDVRLQATYDEALESSMALGFYW